MKTQIQKGFLMIMAVTVIMAGTQVLAGSGMGMGSGSGNGTGNGGCVGTGGGGAGAGKIDGSWEYGYVDALPYETLNEDETAALMTMIQEEKLARDVYSVMYDLWALPMFWNISQSEQRHMNALGALIAKYGDEYADSLQNPVADLENGEFPAAEDGGVDFQALYDGFIEDGGTSAKDALMVAAGIEELDIQDLQELLDAHTGETDTIDNQDIRMVFQNLARGSRNHLRMYVRMLELYGEVYTAQYLTAEELDAILNGSPERGLMDANGNCLQTNFMEQFGNTASDD